MSGKVKRFSLGAVVLSASVVIGVISLGGVGGATAASSAKSHTINLIAVTTSQSPPTKSGSFFESVVGIVSGATISDGVLSCGESPTSEGCDVAEANASGILYAHLTIASTGVLSGTVTGGTGAFANATGTVSGKPVAAGEGITVVYST